MHFKTYHSFFYSCTSGNQHDETNEIVCDKSLESGRLTPPAISSLEGIDEVPCSSGAVSSTPLCTEEFIQDPPNSGYEFQNISISDFSQSFSTACTDELSVLSCHETTNSLPELAIEVENSLQQSAFPSGRVICDIEYVIMQARKLEEHNMTCNYNGKLIYRSVFSRGLVHSYTFVCNKVLCGHKEVIVTDKKGGCLNQLAVLGAMSTGNGFSQEEEKFGIMNMTYMARNTYIASEKAAGDVIASYSVETMNSALEEEKRLAKERKDIDRDGFFNICAIVDGGWCKRTYGHGYNASSGVAVIIAAETKKIIYISVRNKVCLVCQAIDDGRTSHKTHLCSKNWTGPSTAMESDIIVEGLKYLEEVHRVRCTRLIGDGDSNLMKKVQENVSFGSRVIKVECANHAVRRYFKALERIQRNTSKFSGARGVEARKLLLLRMSRLIIGAREGIKRNAVPNLQEPEQQKISKLSAELLNGPAHVFGKHDSCSDFCTRKEFDSDVPIFQIMSDAGIYSAIIKEIQRILVSCCHTLIFNCTNNSAENYMSQFCKTIGGKRIDFSKGSSIKRRADIAAVAYQNPAQKWQHQALKALTGRSPGTPHNKFVSRRLKCHIRRLNKRKLFAPIRRKKAHIKRGGDENYGEKPDIPDLDEHSMKLKSSAHMSFIKVSCRDELEHSTRGQASCEKWRFERSKRIASSFFKDVATRKPTTLCANLVKRILYRDTVSTKAMEYGKANESIAIKQYELEKNVVVQRCGLFVDPTHPFLCTSPDGLIGEDGLLEVKCPFSARNSNELKDVVMAKHDIGLKLRDNKLFLPTTHKYYYQIQGQLAITNRKWCDLYVWSPKDSKVFHINRDVNFWDKIVPKLHQFYMECCVPEIVDPRLPRSKAIREPQFILEAIKQREAQPKKSKPSNIAKRKKDETSIYHNIAMQVSSKNQEVTFPKADTESSQPSLPLQSKRIRKPRVVLDL